MSGAYECLQMCVCVGGGGLLKCGEGGGHLENSQLLERHLCNCSIPDLNVDWLICRFRWGGEKKKKSCITESWRISKHLAGVMMYKLIQQQWLICDF